jgi:hypothetical protein
MARKKANLKPKSTIKQHAHTLASVVLKPIIGLIAQKTFAALFALITEWL